MGNPTEKSPSGRVKLTREPELWNQSWQGNEPLRERERERVSTNHKKRNKKKETKKEKEARNDENEWKSRKQITHREKKKKKNRRDSSRSLVLQTTSGCIVDARASPASRVFSRGQNEPKIKQGGPRQVITGRELGPLRRGAGN